jgi:hypothetical protein
LTSDTVCAGFSKPKDWRGGVRSISAAGFQRAMGRVSIPSLCFTVVANRKDQSESDCAISFRSLQLSFPTGRSDWTLLSSFVRLPSSPLLFPPHRLRSSAAKHSPIYSSIRRRQRRLLDHLHLLRSPRPNARFSSAHGLCLARTHRDSSRQASRGSRLRFGFWFWFSRILLDVDEGPTTTASLKPECDNS